jgi:thiol-disulfide isomerase/thioredoxin
MRRKAIRFLLVLLAAVVAVPAIPSTVDSNADAAQLRKQRRKKTSAAARRRQQLRRLAEARRRAAQQQGAKKQTAPNGNNVTSNKKKSTGSTKKETSRERKPDTEVRAVIKSWKETQEFIGKQKGKVVVVDFWASWCEPCVKELPELVALQKKHPKDVVTISFNLDNDGTEDLKKTVLPNALKTLKKVNAVEVRNIVSRDTDEQAYKLTKLDSVPAIFVFDRTGKLHKRIDVNSAGGKDVSYQKHVVPVVEKLVNSKKP